VVVAVPCVPRAFATVRFHVPATPACYRAPHSRRDSRSAV